MPQRRHNAWIGNEVCLRIAEDSFGSELLYVTCSFFERSSSARISLKRASRTRE